MNILVTGGTRGLGLQIVRQQLELGHALFVVSRGVSNEFKELQSQHPEHLRFIACDLSEVGELKARIFDSVFGSEIPLHALVNNAAIAYDDLASNLDLATLESMYRVNVFAPMQLTKCALRNMILHKTAGSIVHISSICAHTGYKGLSMYASTKGALEAFSKNIAREWGSLGIRSNCVVPGYMETEMSATLSGEHKQRIYQRAALRQATSVESVASMVSYLLSSASCSLTGQALVVDAGTL